MHTDKAYASMAACEIAQLHVFLEDWFTGRCPNSDEEWQRRLLDRFTADFHIIMPAGTLLSGDGLWQPLRGEHGRNPAFKISIRNIAPAATLAAGVSLWTYEEWQRNALNATPPDNGRAASVVFIDDAGTDTGLKWAHVHETWLPAEHIAAEVFDW